MEFKKSFMIFLVLIIIISGIGITIHNDTHINLHKKTELTECFYNVKTLTILKMNLNNKTIYLYDNNFTVITNPKIISILNSTNLVKPFIITDIPDASYNFESYLNMHINIPMNELFFYKISNISKCFVQAKIHFYTGGKTYLDNGLYLLNGIMGYGSGSDYPISNISISFSNTYIFYFTGNSNSTLPAIVHSISMGNFTYSKTSIANVISNQTINDEILFSHSGFYDLTLNTSYQGNLTLNGKDFTLIKNNINGSNNYLLKNGTYTYQFNYRYQNKTYYNNGSFTIYGNPIKLSFSPNIPIDFNFNNVIWILLLIISSMIIIFILRNYLLTLINVIVFIMIGIIDSIGYDLMGYLLMIVLFLTMFIAYNVAMKNGDSIIKYSGRLQTNIKDHYKKGGK